MEKIMIDAHSHLWLRQDTRWNGLEIRTTENGRSMFLGEEVQMLPPFMIDGRNTAEVFLSNMDYAQVQAAVVVQEFIDGLQNDYLLEVGGELGLMYGYVYDGLYTWDEFLYPTTSTYAANPKGKGVVNGILVGGTITDGYEGNSGNGVLGGSHSGYSTMPGKIRIKDLNGDGQIDQNDKTVIGRTTPKWQGGFGISGQWKDFDFVANFTYMLDFDVYNATAYALSSMSSSQNSFTNVYAKFADGRWRYSAPDGFNDLSGHNITGESLYKNGNLDGMPGLYKDMNANVNKWNPADLVTNIMLDSFVEDGSFIRCSDITLGYTLPKSVIKKIYLNKVRAYVSVSNLFILTKYSGYDPEVDVQSGLTPSMDYNRYPRARTFSCGVNVTF